MRHWSRVGFIWRLSLSVPFCAALPSVKAMPAYEQTYEILSQHFAHLSIFPIAAFPLAFAILAANLTLSLVHSSQELRGHMWRYVGAIVGVRIPDKYGVVFFFVGLTAVLWFVGILGLLGIPFASEAVQTGAIWCMIGFRFSDSWNLHYRLANLGYVPNPGLPSAPHYLVEGAILTVLFIPSLLLHPVAAVIGFALGWIFFMSVTPIVRRIPLLIPSLRQKVWQAGQIIPHSAL